MPQRRIAHNIKGVVFNLAALTLTVMLLYYATHRTSDFLQKERFVASLHDMRLV